jgi:ABC-type nickel/cobalt efflux system permease component RcnA
MTLAGWLLMIGSIGLVLALNAYCFYRVFRAPVTKDHLHAPLDIDTHERRK